MDKKLVKALLAEHSKRNITVDVAEKILNSLFKEQVDFLLDPAQFKTACCTRRAGKTYVASAALLYTCLKNENVNCVYIGLSRFTAKRLMWPQLMIFNKKYNLNFKTNLQELSVTLENGSTIYLVGANDQTSCENLRGDKYKLIILDEAASFRRHIDNLIDAIITPALLDLRGTLALIGTPGPLLNGAFYNACHKIKPYANYSNHRWSLLNNPHIRDAAGWLKNYRESTGISENNPIYQREWMGEWVKANDHFVYQIKDKNIIDPPAKSDLMYYILGVDLGYDDATAISVIGYTPQSPVCHVVSTFKKSGMNVTAVIEEVRRFYRLYKPVSVVADTGGLGKAIVEEMKQRYDLPIKPAVKKNKYEYIELMNSDLFENKLMIYSTELDLIEEMQNLQWDAAKREISDRFEDHLCDATLYAWRESKHFTYQAEIPKIEVNTPAYWKQYNEMMLESLLKQQVDDKAWEKELWS